MSYRQSEDLQRSDIDLGGYTIAVIGAWIAFLPLLQILLPLKAAEIEPARAAELLGELAAVGAAVAGVANVAVGWLSDRTRSRHGRRRPWILVGLAGVAASYAAIWQAHSAFAALVAVAAFQASFNMVFSPLLALVADHVPEERRGWASALIGLGKPVGTAFGAIVVGALFVAEDHRFALLGAVVLITIAPFALRLKENEGRSNRETRSAEAGGHDARAYTGNFLLAWTSRVCVLMTFTVVQLYLLYLLQAASPAATAREIGLEVTVLAVVYGIVSAITGVVVGKVSDRTGRRKPIVAASIAIVGASMIAIACAPSWPWVVAAYALYAAGSGIHGTVEFAMIIDILPNHRRAARDLGIINLSNIAPQIAAPLIVTWIVSLHGSTIAWAFGAASTAAAAGMMFVAFMRNVR